MSDVKIAMINSDFKITGILNLYNLCDICINKSINKGGNFLSVVYQPTKYPAINTKFISDEKLEDYNNHLYINGIKKKYSNTISVLIFRSGSIIITGGNNIDQYLKVYKYLINLIKNNLTIIII